MLILTRAHPYTLRRPGIEHGTGEPNQTEPNSSQQSERMNARKEISVPWIFRCTYIHGNDCGWNWKRQQPSSLQTLTLSYSYSVNLTLSHTHTHTHSYTNHSVFLFELIFCCCMTQTLIFFCFGFFFLLVSCFFSVCLLLFVVVYSQPKLPFEYQGYSLICIRLSDIIGLFMLLSCLVLFSLMQIFYN